MGKSFCSEKMQLKKGPWTPEEDKNLLTYIQKHGHGNWQVLPGKAGLQRTGKSCRMRWINYLRPGITRGKFSWQEEQRIIQLHALLGNRWSAIATYLPMRTDNDIKNHWNTHIKKRLSKMGIDPATHRPKAHSTKEAAKLSHMAQWESTRLEAEAMSSRLKPNDVLKAYGTSTRTPTINADDSSSILIDGGLALYSNDLNYPMSILHIPASTVPGTAAFQENHVKDWRISDKEVHMQEVRETTLEGIETHAGDSKRHWNSSLAAEYENSPIASGIIHSYSDFFVSNDFIVGENFGNIA